MVELHEHVLASGDAEDDPFAASREFLPEWLFDSLGVANADRNVRRRGGNGLALDGNAHGLRGGNRRGGGVAEEALEELNHGRCELRGGEIAADVSVARRAPPVLRNERIPARVPGPRRRRSPSGSGRR